MASSHPQTATDASSSSGVRESESARRHAVLGSVSRAALLDALRESAAPMSIAELAAAVGLHANTVRSHLDQLERAGYVLSETEPPRGPGRPRTVYRATAASEEGRNYRLLAELLTRHLAATSPDPTQAAVAAGRAFATAGKGTAGEATAGEGTAGDETRGETAGEDAAQPEAAQALSTLVQILADSGFAPEVAPDGASIALRHCPFKELAQAQRDVVCGVHLGLIQGALHQLHAPIAATRLVPFVEPDRCLTILEPAV
ncbi:MAG: helix-turn-helix transcriptional regulator [Actinomycetes bacterium]